MFEGSLGGVAMRVAGRRTSRPNVAMLGVKPVMVCTVMRYADISDGRKAGQLEELSEAVVLNIWSNVRFILSVCPSERGWKGVVLVLTMPVNLHNSAKSILSKFFP